MPEVNVNVEVYCTCGAGLCNQTESKLTRSRREACFIVAPCESCLGQARREGEDAGYNRGCAEAHEEEQK